MSLNPDVASLKDNNNKNYLRDIVLFQNINLIGSAFSFSLIF
jgi:hypothetical protein